MMEMCQIDNLFKQFNWGRTGHTYTEVTKWLESKGITSHRKQDDLLNSAREYGIIIRNEKKKYSYKGMDKKSKNENAENTMPFQPSDNNEAPF
jgi:hypothetical protein